MPPNSNDPTAQANATAASASTTAGGGPSERTKQQPANGLDMITRAMGLFHSDPASSDADARTVSNRNGQSTKRQHFSPPSSVHPDSDGPVHTRETLPASDSPPSSRSADPHRTVLVSPPSVATATSVRTSVRTHPGHDTEHRIQPPSAVPDADTAVVAPTTTVVAASTATASTATATSTAALTTTPSQAMPPASISNSSTIDSNNNSNSNSKLLSSSSSMTFPGKLYDMLQTATAYNLEHIVSWQDSGRSFKVHDAGAFVDNIMVKFFKQTKYKSFQRQLNLYGFSRITTLGSPYKGGYSHPCFLRGHPEHLHRINRDNNGSNNGSCPTVDATEPRRMSDDSTSASASRPSSSHSSVVDTVLRDEHPPPSHRQTTHVQSSRQEQHQQQQQERERERHILPSPSDPNPSSNAVDTSATNNSNNSNNNSDSFHSNPLLAAANQILSASQSQSTADSSVPSPTAAAASNNHPAALALALAQSRSIEQALADPAATAAAAASNVRFSQSNPFLAGILLRGQPMGDRLSDLTSAAALSSGTVDQSVVSYLQRTGDTAALAALRPSAYPASSVNVDALLAAASQRAAQPASADDVATPSSAARAGSSNSSMDDGNSDGSKTQQQLTSITTKRMDEINTPDLVLTECKFPWKLHDMMDVAESNPKFASIVSWQKLNSHDRTGSVTSSPANHMDGIHIDDTSLLQWAFKVHDPDRFVEELLPLFFKQTKYKSFQRQLNLYGFVRVSTGTYKGCYAHEYFVKGNRALCRHMTRQTKTDETMGSRARPMFRRRQTSISDETVSSAGAGTMESDTASGRPDSAGSSKAAVGAAEPPRSLPLPPLLSPASISAVSGSARTNEEVLAVLQGLGALVEKDVDPTASPSAAEGVLIDTLLDQCVFMLEELEPSNYVQYVKPKLLLQLVQRHGGARTESNKLSLWVAEVCERCSYPCTEFMEHLPSLHPMAAVKLLVNMTTTTDTVTAILSDPQKRCIMSIVENWAAIKKNAGNDGLSLYLQRLPSSILTVVLLNLKLH